MPNILLCLERPRKAACAYKRQSNILEPHLEPTLPVTAQSRSSVEKGTLQINATGYSCLTIVSDWQLWTLYAAHTNTMFWGPTASSRCQVSGPPLSSQVGSWDRSQKPSTLQTTQAVTVSTKTSPRCGYGHTLLLAVPSSSLSFYLHLCNVICEPVFLTD